MTSKVAVVASRPGGVLPSCCVPADHGQPCQSSPIDSSCSVDAVQVRLPNCDLFNTFRYLLVAAVLLWGVVCLVQLIARCAARHR